MAKGTVKPRAPSPPRRTAPSAEVAAICGAAAHALKDWIDRGIVRRDTAIGTTSALGSSIGPRWIKGICYPDPPTGKGPTASHLWNALAWVGAGCPEIPRPKASARPRAPRRSPETQPT